MKEEAMEVDETVSFEKNVHRAKDRSGNLGWNVEWRSWLSRPPVIGDSTPKPGCQRVSMHRSLRTMVLVQCSG
jgi:hypothetical protein